MEIEKPYFFSDRSWEAVRQFYAEPDGDLLENGPGHIVFADGNLMDGHIDWCLELCRDKGFEHMGHRIVYGDDECRIAEPALRALRMIPEEER